MGPNKWWNQSSEASEWRREGRARERQEGAHWQCGSALCLGAGVGYVSTCICQNIKPYLKCEHFYMKTVLHQQIKTWQETRSCGWAGHFGWLTQTPLHLLRGEIGKLLDVKWFCQIGGFLRVLKVERRQFHFTTFPRAPANGTAGRGQTPCSTIGWVAARTTVTEWRSANLPISATVEWPWYQRPSGFLSSSTSSDFVSTSFLF